ncbi:type I restriction endonuclease subunit R, EcoR124 family [Bifidobacterium adolescentis]|uniref:Type I restriction enzyme endonuclease subunit n=1 Tax=Bifidobacterium adolescentis TaxID=1680 RepID=A0A173ZNH8_BIFAD|nr:HsdR family type I site-specific deoxyribonuclease [Bifidobacterium adolescentis]CUN76765.1 HsdR-like protein of type I restriction modification system [Bifidobacterium adolescentis]
MFYDKESDFEDDLVAVLKRHGWTDGVLEYPTEQDLISNWANILFDNNKGIDRLNGQRLTKGEMAQILEQIETLRTPLALNSFINGKTVSIKRDNPADPAHFGKEISLKIYDRQEIAAGQSRYQIARQPMYPAKNKMLNDRRGDVCLLINGMPVIHIELKKSGIPISQATNQIAKYAHEGVFTGLFRLVQVFVAMNPDDAVYFANPGEGDFNSNYFFHWADFNNEPIAANKHVGQDEWKRFASDLLSIPMAHQLIGFYTVADSADGCLKVLRSYQYQAVNAISDRVRTCKWDEPVPSGTPGRPGGYVWHTTGSGKTMTSFKAAQLIADSKDADKVIFLMDRIELGTQSLLEYRSFADDADDVQGTENTDVLKAKLASIDPKDTLIVTSIQKMSNIKAGEGHITEEEVKKLAGKRIVFIIDECHRSTFGEMLQDIRRSFPNALYFGFTGTPIHEENRKKGATTSMVFGDCLHRYSIADGIRDGNVLGFDPYMVLTYRDRDVRQVVALEKAKASTIEEAQADPAKAEVFYHYMDPNQMPMGPMETQAGERIKGIEDYLTSAQYAQGTPHEGKVVEDILDQFPLLSRGNKFHAMLATSSIPEAISYYRLFKERAPQMHVTALFDPNVDNSNGAILKGDALQEIIGDYNELFGKDFIIPTWPKMKKDITARLSHKRPYLTVDQHREERIDLLIVVDQMLTGFDSKWVNTLYLDKIIDYENIIQAFSRTNRLFGPDKPFGTIRYYRKPHTMKGYIEAAVKLYSGDKPLDLFVQKLPENVRLMDARFEEIASVFRAEGVEDFMKLPESVEACRKFAKLFSELNDFLEAAKVQGFTWQQREYSVTHDDGSVEVVRPELDERTYMILVQRYKELFAGDGEGHSEGPEAPYDLDGHITEIDTGLIDTDYMNANFTKWLKALGGGDPDLLASAEEELHKSFASLSQEEQRYAELFMHDVERGEIELEEGKTLRDYITYYANSAKNSQVEQITKAFDVDGALLNEMMRLDLTETTLNEFGRFDRLKASVNRSLAKAFFDKPDSPVSQFTANLLATKLLKSFILEGGFDLDDRK